MTTAVWVNNEEQAREQINQYLEDVFDSEGTGYPLHHVEVDECEGVATLKFNDPRYETQEWCWDTTPDDYLREWYDE